MRKDVVRDTLVLQCDVEHTFHAKVVCATSCPDCDVCHIMRCVCRETLSRISVMWLTLTPVAWCSAHCVKDVACCTLVSDCGVCHTCEKM